MNDVLVAAAVFLGAFGAAAAAMWLRRSLPEHHLTSEAKDTVKVSMAMVATMTALVLGLLVSSSRGAYESQRGVMIEMSAKIAFFDRSMALYGPEADEARALMRNAASVMLHRYWPESELEPVQVNPETVSAEALYHAVQALEPGNDVQKSLKASAVDTILDIGLLRWMIFGQSGPSISTPLLCFVGCWLGLLFFSFGLFAPPNATVLAAIGVSAISVASAVFLILELDRPFEGILKISSRPLVDALTIIGAAPL